MTDSLSGALINLGTTEGTGILADNIFLRISVLVLFIAYMAIIARYMGHILAISSLTRGRSYVEKLLNDQNYSFERFVTISNFIGYLIISVTIIKWFDVMTSRGGEVFSELPEWLPLTGVGILWIVLILVGLFQKTVLKTTGHIILNRRFTDKIIYLRRLTISFLAVLTAPFVLMLALAPPAAAKILLIIVLIEYCAFVLFFLFRSWMLFIEQKISIFYWFLYLCAVEVFPLTVPVAIVLRNIG